MDDAHLTLDADTLLSHAPWLRRLARSLVGEDRVEDVVQQTWLQALSHPPRDAAGLRGFLAKTARHIAWRSHDRESRRSARERKVARVEAIPSTEEALDQLHLQRLVVDAVLTLPESQREVVLLRYFHGVEPARIASRLGIPGSTVRSTLTRALARLRQHLDHNWQGASAWRLAILPLASCEAFGPRTHGVVRVARVLGLATAVGVGTWLLLRAPSIEGNAAQIDLPAVTVDTDRTGETATIREATPSAHATTPSTSTRDALTPLAVDDVAAPALAVQVRHHDGRAALDVPVILQLLDLTQWNVVAVERSNELGIARFDHALASLPPLDRSRRLRVVAGVHARHLEAIPFHANTLGDTPLEIVLPALGRVVLAADSRSITRSSVTATLALPDEDSIPHIKRLGLCSRPSLAMELGLPLRIGEDRFVFPHVELGMELFLDVRNAEPRTSVIEGPRFANEDVVVGLNGLSAKGRVRARITGGDGRPVAHERLRILFGEVNPREELSIRLVCDTDAQGEWNADLPLVDDPRVSQWMMVERTTPTGTLECAWFAWPSGTKRRDLGNFALHEPPVLLQGAVTDLDGRPLPGILVRGMRGPRLPSGTLPLPHRIELGCETRTNETGAFTLRGLAPPGSLVWAVAQNPAGLPSQSPPSPAGTTGLLLALEQAPFLRGRAVTDEFVPVENMLVSVEHGGRTFAVDRLRHDGSFAIGPLTEPVDTVTFALGPASVARYTIDFTRALRRPQRFDLRSQLAPLDLIVQDERGTPLVGEELYVRRQADLDAVVSNGTKASGHVRFLVPSSETSFFITGVNTWPALVERRDTPQVLRLRRAAMLDLTCVHPELPGHLIARALLMSDDARRIDAVAPGAARDVRLDENGHALVPLSLVGRWRVQIVWKLPRAFGRALEVPITHEPVWLDVHEASPFNRRLVLDRSAIETARQRFY
ncbi:MAG: sigma-70 family RNA polymerase sigma factor [Planctomycetes bacterium]|nr:sigma-70 family RNA polymerase sigma factor [Planctomycetota bacterium]